MRVVVLAEVEESEKGNYIEVVHMEMCTEETEYASEADREW